MVGINRKFCILHLHTELNKLLLTINIVGIIYKATTYSCVSYALHNSSSFHSSRVQCEHGLQELYSIQPAWVSVAAFELLCSWQSLFVTLPGKSESEHSNDWITSTFASHEVSNFLFAIKIKEDF